MKNEFVCRQRMHKSLFFSHKKIIEFWFFDRQVQEAVDGVWFGSRPGRSAGGREGHSTPSAGTGSGACEVNAILFFLLSVYFNKQ